jgi:hypothetical protein
MSTDKPAAVQHAKIYSAIPAIMAEVGAVEKSRKNTAQGYAFRGIDEVYGALQLVMAKHGVFVVPVVLTQDWGERPTKGGGSMLRVVTTIRHTFFASDGSSVEAVTLGEGMDSGDKSANKAMSVALKYALLEVFCIPTSDPKDPENDSHELAAPEPTPAARATAQASDAQTDYSDQLFARLGDARHPDDVAAIKKEIMGTKGTGKLTSGDAKDLLEGVTAKMALLNNQTAAREPGDDTEVAQ